MPPLSPPMPSLFDREPAFDGDSFDPVLDAKRLTSQLQAVQALMRDGRWRTLSEIRTRVGGSEAGISARLRDCRKPAHGGYVVNRRRRGEPRRGLWEYQVIGADK